MIHLKGVPTQFLDQAQIPDVTRLQTVTVQSSALILSAK